jgi:hypothetical protein
MKIPHEQLIKVPEVLFCREHRLKERHEFLRYLKRDQYNPKEKLYVSPVALATLEDREFVVNVCDSNMETYQDFLKTL